MIQRRFRQSVLARLHLARVQSAIARMEQGVLAEFGLTPAQFDVLSRLATEPGASQQALADHLLVTKGNVCGLIDRLEQAGFVERLAHPDDRRTNQLHLTAAGRQAFEVAAPALEAVLDDQFSVLSEDEKGQLMGLLAKMDRTLNR
jgi:DNA-binding MarR family transcriptional regulator